MSSTLPSSLSAWWAVAVTAGSPEALITPSPSNAITNTENAAGNATMPAAAAGKQSEEVLQMVLLSFFMIIALVGNTSVLIYLYKTQGCQRPVTIFVMSLAISDILIAIFSMSTELIWDAFGGWILGAFACKLITYVQCLLFATTAFILMSMSFDRYEAICKPMAFSRTISRSRKMIVASWILAIIVAIPQLFIFLQVTDGTYPDGTAKYACKSQGYSAPWQRKLYVSWLASYVFVVPLCFVAFCYIKIALVVWRSTNQHVQLTNGGGSTGGSESVALRRNNVTVDGSVERAKVRTIQITICILSCYMFCWAPYFTMTLLNVWTDYRYRKVIPPAVRTLAQCLAWFSSCVNPIIYVIFNMPIKAMFDRCVKGKSAQKLVGVNSGSTPSLHHNGVGGGKLGGRSPVPSTVGRGSDVGDLPTRARVSSWNSNSGGTADTDAIIRKDTIRLSLAPPSPQQYRDLIVML
ncbi:putative Vasopressin V1a receptor [Hypsibius exemplaris]|uniref:Vasopressin V1a receptor n=1 Tax=Hypsibius exemplaris TaxID=2072580 RepID=A0A1W0WZQ7_HYPEX|nr:putative Vasopressin V1a receptor [Hypsibius exemplaris]